MARPAEPTFRVRRATASDAAAVRRIAHAAWRATYTGLLHDETIEGFLDRAYSDERVELRIARHEMWVVEADGAVALFAEAAVEPDRVTLVAIYADPERRGRGFGTAALEAIRATHQDLPVAADVLVGNAKGETFYAARGFVPRESIDEDLGTERAAERRWWLDVEA